jgi:hypothetical protein
MPYLIVLVFTPNSIAPSLGASHLETAWSSLLHSSSVCGYPRLILKGAMYTGGGKSKTMSFSGWIESIIHLPSPFRHEGWMVHWQGKSIGVAFLWRWPTSVETWLCCLALFCWSCNIGGGCLQTSRCGVCACCSHLVSKFLFYKDIDEG